MRQHYRHQIDGAWELGRLGGRAILADDCGLGKTSTTLLYLARRSSRRPSLVVCLPNHRGHWRREAGELGMTSEVIVRQPQKGWRPRTDVTVMSWAKLWEWSDNLSRAGFRSVLFDECHSGKNPEAKRTRAMKVVCKGVPYVIGISGTPIVSCPIEFFPILNIIRPDLFPSRTAYGNRFCGPTMTNWGPKYNGASNLHELRELLRGVLLRRMTKDTDVEIPEQTFSLEQVALCDEGEEEYAEAEADFIAWLRHADPLKAARASRAEAIQRMMVLRRLAGLHKVPAVCTWLAQRLAHQKVVCMAWNTEVIERIESRFKHCCLRLDGKSKKKIKDNAERLFNTDPRKTLFLAQITSGGTGLNLTSARTVAMAQLPWTPGDLFQCARRVKRIGQGHETELVCLVAAGTVEEKNARILVRKQAVLDATLGDGRGSEQGGDLLRELFEEVLND